MNQINKVIKTVKEQLDTMVSEKILLGYQILIQSDMSLELKLLVKHEIDEEKAVFSLEPFKSNKAGISITQFLDEEYDEEFKKTAFGGPNKINKNFRRQLNILLDPKPKSFDVPIVTFYSYKGGLGRTTALACFAAYMAMSHNKKVVVVDCDFEAPGFSNGNYFFVDIRKEVCGLAEYLLDKEYLNHLGQKPDLKDYVYNVDHSFTKGATGQGEIFIIPSGNTKDQSTYLESLARLDLAHEIEGFIEDIKNTFFIGPDGNPNLDDALILFDSRTGFNDTFATLAEVSDTIVGLFGINQQNEAGIKFFIKHFLGENDKNVFFIKGLAENGKKESQRLEEIIKNDDGNEKTIKHIVSDDDDDANESKVALYISYIDRIPLLQNLGVLEVKENKQGQETLMPLVDEEDFRDFLLSIEKEKDKANMSAFFPQIARSIKVKKKNETPSVDFKEETVLIDALPPSPPVAKTLTIAEKISEWEKDSSRERMFQLKFEFLKTIQSPILWAEHETDLEKLSDTFYFRAVMRDFFHRNKFIILGGKGSGKTYWYRLLDENQPTNGRLLNYLCSVQKKKKANYIFVNAIDINNYLAINRITGINIDKLEVDAFKAFWILYVHYAVFRYEAVRAVFTSKIADNANTFNAWVGTYIKDNSFDSVSAERELQALNLKLKEKKQELIVSFDYLDKIVEMKYWKIAVSQLIRFWDNNPDYSHIYPKIFVRADLFNPDKIGINNFLGTKNYSTINLTWSKDELFAYFFTSILKDETVQDLFFHYLICLQENKHRDDAQEIITDIRRQLNGETKQIAPVAEDMKKLAVIFFSETSDFDGGNNFRYPSSYDWFMDNLQDALGQTSLRAFWELISLSVNGKSTNDTDKREFDKAKPKDSSEIGRWENKKTIPGRTAPIFLPNSRPYPLIEPRFYTWKGHREDAAKQVFDETRAEFGNGALEDLHKFFTDDLLPAEKKHNYLRPEFESLISKFLKGEFAKKDSNIHQIVDSDNNTGEIIRWLVNNGIVKEVITNYGDNIKYIFPYFYRSLFNLKNEKRD